jgi:hypothetical protein
MIAVVVPTIRPDTSMKEFVKEWAFLFEKHNVKLITVLDGEKPTVVTEDSSYSMEEIMGEYSDTIFNFNGGVRNLGFAYVAKFMPEIEYIFTFDDDVRPIGDTIQDHLDALNSRVPVSWLSTATDYTRGFPYAVRKEAEVVLSHGVWEKNPDWDAPTHLVLGDRETTYYKGPIPRGIYYPFCSMNVACKRKFLPYIYHAPATLGVVRANDIFCGITSKRVIDKKGWAVVNGMATVLHEKASNVFKSLVAEAVEIGLNETYWQGDETNPYFKVYNEKRKRWGNFIKKLENESKN